MKIRVFTLVLLALLSVEAVQAGSYKFDDIVSYIKDDRSCCSDCKRIIPSIRSMPAKAGRAAYLGDNLREIYPEAVQPTAFVQLGEESGGVILPSPMVYSIAPRLHVVIKSYSSDMRAPSCFYLQIDMGYNGLIKLDS